VCWLLTLDDGCCWAQAVLNYTTTAATLMGHFSFRLAEKVLTMHSCSLTLCEVLVVGVVKQHRRTAAPVLSAQNVQMCDQIIPGRPSPRNMKSPACCRWAELKE
jgi:hypothetical protein